MPGRKIKMKLYNIGSNQTETTTENARILFSYNTPVAAYIYGRGYIRTAEYHSRTTSKHINAWINGSPEETVDPAEIEALIK